MDRFCKDSLSNYMLFINFLGLNHRSVHMPTYSTKRSKYEGSFVFPATLTFLCSHEVYVALLLSLFYYCRTLMRPNLFCTSKKRGSSGRTSGYKCPCGPIKKQHCRSALLCVTLSYSDMIKNVFDVAFLTISTSI